MPFITKMIFCNSLKRERGKKLCLNYKNKKTLRKLNDCIYEYEAKLSFNNKYIQTYIFHTEIMNPLELLQVL